MFASILGLLGSVRRGSAWWVDICFCWTGISQGLYADTMAIVLEVNLDNDFAGLVSTFGEFEEEDGCAEAEVVICREFCGHGYISGNRVLRAFAVMLFSSPRIHSHVGHTSFMVSNLWIARSSGIRPQEIHIGITKRFSENEPFSGIFTCIFFDTGGQIMSA